MEYLYIFGIVGYYLYKFYSNNKKKERENLETLPPTQNTTKKKKGFFDDFLEELEKQKQAPPTKTVQEPSNKKNHEPAKNREQKTEPRRENPVKKVQKKPAPLLVDDFSKPLNKYFEMPQNDLNDEISNTDIQSILEKPENHHHRKKFAGMNMSPKEALKAQIILEKKY